MKKLKSIIPLALTVIILSVLFFRIDFKNIVASIKLADKGLLFLSILILLATLLISALRWQNVLKIIDHRLTYGRTLKTYLATMPVSKITPGSAGDFIRAYYLKNEVPVSINIGAIFLERIFDVAALAVLSIIGGFILKMHFITLASSLVLTAIIIFFLIAPRINFNATSKWRIRIQGFFHAFRVLRQQPWTLVKVIASTFLLWLTIIIHFKISFLAFNSGVSFLSILAIQPIVIFTGLLPITIAGIGARESAMIYLYSTLAPYPNILAVGLIYSFVGTVIVSLIGLPFMIKIVKPKLNI